MIYIINKSLHFDNELKKKIEFAYSFCNTISNIMIEYKKRKQGIKVSYE